MQTSRKASQAKVSVPFLVAKWAWLVLLLCAVAMMLRGFGQYYFGMKEGDVSFQFYPFRSFLSRWFQRGIYPFWNPHMFNGYPVIEIQQMMTFEPISALVALFLNPRLGLISLMASYVLVGGLATYWGMRRALGVSTLAAGLGTASYIFGATYSMRIAAMHVPVVGAVSLMPLATLAIYRSVLDGKGSRSGLQRFGWLEPLSIGLQLLRNPPAWMILGTVANAYVILMGSPQYVVYLGWMELVVAFAAAGRRWLVALAVMGITWSLALVLSAPQWLSAMWYLPFTGRANTRGMQDAVTPAALLWTEFLLPWPIGDDMRQSHLYMKNATETLSYPGALLIILTALFLMLRRFWRSPARRAALALLVLSVVLLMGIPLPGFSKFREPLKARIILSFAMSMAAALQFDVLVALRRYSNRRLITLVRRLALLLLFLSIGAAVVSMVVPQQLGRYYLGFGMPFDPNAADLYNFAVSKPEIVAHRFMHAALHLAMFTAAILVAISLYHQHRALAAGSLVLLGSLDPFLAHYYAYLSRNPYDWAELPAPFVDFMKGKQAEDEVTGHPPWRIMLPNDICGRTQLVDGVWETGGYDPLMPFQTNSRTVLDTGDKTALLPQNISERMAAIARRYNAFHWEPRKESFSPGILEEVCPQASIATLERRLRVGLPRPGHFGPSIDGWHYVLPGTKGWEIHPSESSSPEIDHKVKEIEGSAGISTSSETLKYLRVENPNEYNFQVKLDAPALLVLRMTWLPGWKVQVDGNSQNALFTNGWMVGSFVDSGTHSVRFYYRPVFFRTSLVLSLAGCVAVTGLLMARRRAFRRLKGSESQVLPLP